MKKNEHKTGSDIKDWKTRAEVPPNEIKPFLDNPFLKDFHGHSMIYTKDFYMALYKKISDEHMTYVEAYNALGFDTGILGTNRANAAGKRAVRMAEENRLFTVAHQAITALSQESKWGICLCKRNWRTLKPETHI